MIGGAWLFDGRHNENERMKVLDLVGRSDRLRVPHIDHHYYLPRSKTGCSLFFVFFCYIPTTAMIGEAAAFAIVGRPNR